jgi:hypothetical protein
MKGKMVLLLGIMVLGIGLVGGPPIDPSRLPFPGAIASELGVTLRRGCFRSFANVSDAGVGVNTNTFSVDSPATTLSTSVPPRQVLRLKFGTGTKQRHVLLRERRRLTIWSDPSCSRNGCRQTTSKASATIQPPAFRSRLRCCSVLAWPGSVSGEGKQIRSNSSFAVRVSEQQRAVLKRGLAAIFHERALKSYRHRDSHFLV